MGKKIFMGNTEDEEVEEVNELSVFFPPKFMISFAEDTHVGESTLPQYILERN